MAITVGPDGVAGTLADILKAFDEEARQKVAACIDETAAQLVENLKRDSPDSGRAHSKKYNKGWTMTTMYQSDLEKRVTVHNKDAPHLTHLLERGHAKRNGGRVAARPHIAQNEEEATKNLVDGIEKAISSG